jgi:hypothetical protein
MPANGPDVVTFAPANSLETLLLETIKRAAQEHQSAIVVSGQQSAETTLRGEFLAWVLCSQSIQIAPTLTRISIRGARIIDEFDISSQSVMITARFIACTFLDRIRLSDCKLPSFEIFGGELQEIIADRVTTSGPFAVRKATARDSDASADQRQAPIVHKQIRIHGATIGGNFDLRGCRLLGEDATPLFADGLVVKGNALLSDRFESTGEIRLNGCHIARNLDFSGAKLRHPFGNCLSVEQSRVSGDAYFCFPRNWPTYPQPFRFSAVGTVVLTGTKIEGEMDCGGGFFAAPIYAVRNPKIRCEDDDFDCRLSKPVAFPSGTAFASAMARISAVR